MELSSILSERGRKAEIQRSTKIGSATLYRIQRGIGVPSDVNLRAIASALGLPADYFLEPNADKQTVRQRLVFEVLIPKGIHLNDDDVEWLRQRVGVYAHDMIKGIKELRK